MHLFCISHVKDQHIPVVKTDDTVKGESSAGHYHCSFLAQTNPMTIPAALKYHLTSPAVHIKERRSQPKVITYLVEEHGAISCSEVSQPVGLGKYNSLLKIQLCEPVIMQV